MTSTGSFLGLQLGELWLCANVHLPAAAAEYVSLATKASGTADGDAAFGRAGFVPGAPGDIAMTQMGEIYPVWSLMRDQFQTLMVKSAQNLYDTCDALTRVTEVFTNVDGENATDIDAAGAAEGFDEIVNGGGGYEGYRNDDEYAAEVIEADDRETVPEERTELNDENYE